MRFLTLLNPKNDLNLRHFLSKRHLIYINTVYYTNLNQG